MAAPSFSIPDAGSRIPAKPVLAEEDGCTAGDGFYCGCEACEAFERIVQADRRHYKSTRW